MNSIKKSIANSAAQQYIVVAIQFFSTVILARLLTPSEIGIYSIGAAAVAVAHIVRDFGVTAYIIQDPDLDRERVRTAFTITLIIGVTLGAMTLVFAPWVASYYGEPGVKKVLNVIAFNFFLIPFGSVAMALLRRDMRFDITMWIGIASIAGHALTGVTLAYLGFGFLSMAWASLAGVVVQVVAASIYSPRAYLGWPTLSERRKVLSFGGRIGAANIAYEIAQSAPTLILGRLHGFVMLGYFSRALGFVQLFETIVIDCLRPVLFPYMAKENREGRNLKEAYVTALALLTGVAWPAVAVLGIFAAPAISILYGDQWYAAIPIAHLLCWGIAVRALGVVTGATLTASGHAREVLRVGLLAAITKVGGVLLLGPFGIQYAALAFVAAELITNTLSIGLVCRRLHISAKQLLYPLAQSAIITAITAVSSLVGVEVLGPGISVNLGILNTSAAILFSIVIWGLVLVLFKHPIIVEVRQLVASIWHRDN